ncbi:TIGR01244 family sulfur transferase [Alysiella filiformis]|uniref:TIGR01244 family protein n=1 Tax=Alysiella filiformis DSM 16848 TaxID=1120981 RepID=A0A286EG78_9NEIS|nr:TIGR01244 family sulfur transferase [Alysiella filiformis]QMT30517.1 TIGR01244 family phosphatase [Alysiella filiformis]UBQ56503.1 TIGR01244 family phosphatase [Alysiella filiformis DSM 16848]SOD69926.1 TIGR01244 family protein [Alysiella filiformis DSM 16848]
MSIEKIADYLYVSRQLNERTAKQVAQYEIKTVICNRPDGEEENQPSFETVKAWLNAAGIEKVVYMPTTMESMTDAQLKEFQDTVAQSPAPILAYCRSGTRSAMLWALNQAKRGVEVNSLIRAADLAGIDLSKMRDKLEAVSPKKK